VGVVIPTYERVEETMRAVHSVLGQTVAPAHVVVTDDGSSASTVAALAERLAGGPAELVRAPRSGHPGRVRNEGLARLDTEWVAFLDSDDTWHTEKLERQLAVAGTGSVAVCTNARRIVADAPSGTVLDSLPARLGLRDLVRENKVINSSVLIRRDVLYGVGGIASSYLVRGCEDYATWLRVATRHDWAGLDQPLVDYVDEPAASIRGSEEFAAHAGQVAAWIDFVMWCRDSGSPLRLPERVVSAGLRWALLLSARRVATGNFQSLAEGP
jgi:glycosyltransferase involved in cell wall biosynthesis